MEETAQLFASQRQGLVNFASGILKNSEDAQDVVQEVFSELILKNIEPPSRSYLFKAVRNRSFNKMRSLQRFDQALGRFSEYLKLLAIPEHESDLSMADILKTLSVKQSEVVLLRVKNGFKISEISEILEIPEGTVKSRLNQALKKIKEKVHGRSKDY